MTTVIHQPARRTQTPHRDPFTYTPQSPTPDSPPPSPISKLRILPKSHPMPSSTHSQDERNAFGTPFLPINTDRITPEASPDSASGGDEDEIALITPANSARPSVVSSSLDRDPKRGLGIAFPQQHVYLNDMSDEEESRRVHVDAAETERRGEPSRIPASRPWQDIPKLEQVVHHYRDGSAATSSSTEPRSPTETTRERLISPTRLKSFADQQDEYQLKPHEITTPNLQSYSPIISSPAMDGKKEPSIREPPANYGGLGYNYEPGYPSKSNSHPFSRNRQAYDPASPQSTIPHNIPSGHQMGTYSWKPRQNSISEKAASGLRYGAGVSRRMQGSMKDSAAYWLGLYFVFNLGLTLFNKFVLVSFPFPYTLTGLHALSGCIGTYIAHERGSFVPARLTQRENLTLGAFSVLYTINIAVSNISLQLVTVPFHQVVRASTPIFTIIISAAILRTRFTVGRLVSLLPVVAGVGFATYGDYYFTAWGLILTLLGTFLAAMKTVVTNLIQTGGGGRLRLHPLDLLMRMSPLAFIQCVIYGWYTGELDRVRQFGALHMTTGKAFALLINGVIAFGLNIVSFTANKKTGPLTMTVSANCKQVMTIALAVILFDLHISFMNAIGIALTLLGGAWYGWVEYTDKKKRSIRLGVRD